MDTPASQVIQASQDIQASQVTQALVFLDTADILAQVLADTQAIQVLLV